MEKIAAAVIAVFVSAGAAFAEIVDLVVPVRTIAAGEIIDGEPLRAKAYRLRSAAVRFWITDRQQIEGKEAKRMLPAGQPIPLAALKLPDHAKRGVPQRAVFVANGIEIVTTLVPLRDAPAGTMIEARNAETGAIVEVLVGANGELIAGDP